jgi:hypothetical protein
MIHQTAEEWIGSRARTVANRGWTDEFRENDDFVDQIDNYRDNEDPVFPPAFAE